MSWNDSFNKFVCYVLKNYIKLILPLTAREGGLFERCACYLYISWEKKMFMHNLKNLHSFMLFKNKFNVYIVEKMVWLNMIYWIKSHSCMPNVTVWSSWVPSTGGTSYRPLTGEFRQLHLHYFAACSIQEKHRHY